MRRGAAPRPGVHARCLGRRAELIRAGITDYGGLWLAVTPSGEAIERVWAVLTKPGHIGVWFGQGTPAEVDLHPGGIMILDHGEYGTFPTASRRSTRRATSPTAEPAPIPERSRPKGTPLWSSLPWPRTVTGPA
jgi:hypothetical protein